eukprot:SAG22_NODE_894_length_6640_cov_3.923559_4_plen_880_part_00
MCGRAAAALAAVLVCQALLPAAGQVCNSNDPNESGGTFVPAIGTGGADWCVYNTTDGRPGSPEKTPVEYVDRHNYTIACVPAPNDPQAVGAVVYLVLLFYFFSGVGIIADKFMDAIAVVTSKSKLVERVEGGVTKQYEIKAWNATVANLTLMALGSSAPEILLNVIGLFTMDFYAGELGPGTIVGSAAFNLFIIIAVCVMVIPVGETRKIADMQVFGITAFASVFAYLWLLIILMAITPNIVDVWEAAVTFLMFPMLVIFAFMADKGWCSKRNSVVPSSSITSVTALEDTVDEKTGEHTIRRNSLDEGFSPFQVEAALKAEKGLLKSGTDPNVLAMEVFKKSKPMTRADYHRLAVRKMTGAKEKAPVIEVNAEDKKSRVGFANTQWKVSEATESVTLTVKRFGYTKESLSVDYSTEAGSATAGLDFKAQAGTATFEPDMTECEITVHLLDDNKYEKDEFFTVKLGNVSDENADVNGERGTSKVIIVDNEKEPPVLNMRQTETGNLTAEYAVHESDGHVNVAVERLGDHSKRCTVKYATKAGSATANVDYVEMEGTLTFEAGQTLKFVEVQIIDDEQYEKDEEFTVTISDAEGASLGTIITSVVTIVNDDELTEVVERVAKLLALNLDKYREGGRNWRAQFTDAIKPDGEWPEGVANNILHWMNVPWNLIFAFCPPTSLCGGWLCFAVSLIMIGFVTMFIEDLARLFGCCVGLEESITAITLVALGTSLPDTFASKAAAIGDSTADAAVGNVTGSNSVNVFLGLGLPWLIGAIYWSHMADEEAVEGWLSKYRRDYGDDQGVMDALALNPGGAFMVPAGTLGFSVIVFSGGATTVLGGIMLRRKLFGAELGGPWAKIYGFIFIMTWFTYVALSIMNTKGVF